MRIKSLTFADPHRDGWTLDPLRLKPGMNLFVGASGSGKTRVLNILFNIGTFAVPDIPMNGQWALHFEHLGIEYTWKYDGVVFEDRDGHVLQEELWIGSPDRVGTSIISRTKDRFEYIGREIPKLGKQSSAIYLLREEDDVKPIHEGFSLIMRRRFWSEDLSNAIAMQSIPRQVIRKLDKRADMNEIFKSQVSLHVVMYLLDRYFKNEYGVICEQFTRVFPFVDSLEMRTASDALNMPLGGDVPVVLIKERGIKKPVPLGDIASGMQKVLLIIADVIISPGDTLYMIDEYENSLGVNAIDFLPSFVAECGGSRQFIVTTHHPLLINAIPVADWFVFHRKGLNIKVTHGEEIEGRYGRSKQQRFVQLINDPIYAEGVE